LKSSNLPAGSNAARPAIAISATAPAIANCARGTRGQSANRLQAQ
jgi:hypothetical protein